MLGKLFGKKSGQARAAVAKLANTVTIPVATDPMHIDDRVRMAANAKRYEWLRDRSCIEDADNDIMVVRGDKYFDGAELDTEIDNALRLVRLEELHPCAD
jgi:cell division GTPase FtsZ